MLNYRLKGAKLTDGMRVKLEDVYNTMKRYGLVDYMTFTIEKMNDREKSWNVHIDCIIDKKQYIVSKIHRDYYKSVAEALTTLRRNVLHKKNKI